MAKKEKLSLANLLVQALVKDEQYPYEVPSNWVWVTLGLINSRESKTVNPNSKPEEKFELYSVPSYDESYPEVILGVEIGSTKQLVSKDDVLLCKINPRINRVWIVGNHTEFRNIASSEWIAITTPKLNSKYIMWCLRSKYFRELMVSNVSGVGGSLTRSRPKEVFDYPIPLPPLSEQQRIVNLIELLFEELDRAKELVQNALDSFENRKSAIFHKAFTGELTVTWREENNVTPSEQNFEIIKRQRLDIATNKETKVITDSFNRFNLKENKLPNGWIKLKAMMVCENITCGKTPSDKIDAEGDIPFLKVYNIVNNKVDFNYRPQFIDAETHNEKLKSSKLLPDDVVMNIVGPPLRKIAIIPNDYPEWNMNQAIVRFRTIEYVDCKFLYYCLLNDETLDEVISETKGVVGQANISITQSRNLLIPIPSIEEQKEIVRILDNLLENEQKAKELYDVIENIDLMKKSILARAFRGELNTNNPDEESALELLKEVLREKSI
jgi:type I restriction enzyme S subunit